MVEQKKTVSLLHRSNIPEKPFDYSEKSVSIIQEMLEEGISGLDVSRGFFRNSSILIKPNLVRPDLPKQPAASTDPRVVTAAIRVFRDLGASTITVGENPGYGFPAERAFKEGMLLDELKKTNVRLSFFDEEKVVRIENPDGILMKRVYAAESVLENDLFVNLPKMKTHMHTLVSLGLKNLQGILLDPQRRIFHRSDIHQKIVDVFCAVKPDFTIIDGIWAMEGQAPFFGNTVRDSNILLCGTSALALDAWAAHLMSIRPVEVDHLRIAAQMNLGSIKLEKENLCGVDPEDIVQRPFERPVLGSAGLFPNLHVVEGGACSGCLSALRHSVDKLQFENMIQKMPECSVFLGKIMPNIKTLSAWKGENLYLLGNCAADLVFSSQNCRLKPIFIPGCPPHVLDFYKTVAQNMK